VCGKDRSATKVLHIITRFLKWGGAERHTYYWMEYLKKVAIKHGLDSSEFGSMEFMIKGSLLKRWQHVSHLRMAYILANPKKTDYIIDVGCGQGLFPLSLASKCKKIIGIDPRCDVSRLSFIPMNVQLIKAKGQELPIQSRYCDVAFCLETPEHISPDADRLKVIKEIHRVLKPGGIATFSIPIEIGIPLLLKLVAPYFIPSFAYKSSRQELNMWQALRAIFLRDVSGLEHSDHFAFDYRLVIQEMQQFFSIKCARGTPVGRLSYILGTTIVMLAEKNHDSR